MAPGVEAGTWLGERYRLVERVGEGAMGEVWRAADTLAPGSPAAVKLLRPELLRFAQGRRRFAQEVEALSRLIHPNVARLRGFEAEREPCFLALDFVEGPTLGELLLQVAGAGGQLELPRIRRLFLALAGGVAAAHAAGVVHRDLKPANVLVRDGDGEPVVVDFGVAKLAGPASEATTLGRLVGSWFYMAPEQMRGEEVDARADIFALGVLLYELLSLERPFLRLGGHAVRIDQRLAVAEFHPHLLLERIVLEPAPALAGRRPDLPPALDGVLARCLAPDLAARFAGVDELRSAFEAAWAERVAARPAGQEAPARARAPTAALPALADGPGELGPPGEGEGERDGLGGSVTWPEGQERAAPAGGRRPGSLGLQASWGAAVLVGLTLVLGAAVLFRGHLAPERGSAGKEPIAEPGPLPAQAEGPRAAQRRAGDGRADEASGGRAAPARGVSHPVPEGNGGALERLRGGSPPAALPAPARASPRAGDTRQGAPPSALARARAALAADPQDPRRRRALERALLEQGASLAPAQRAEVERCVTAARFAPGPEALLGCAQGE